MNIKKAFDAIGTTQRLYTPVCEIDDNSYNYDEDCE